jgi:UDPglucose--hexose-1-phosphate uridylyltransferase
MSKFIFDKLTSIPTILATDRAKRVDQTGAVNGTVKKHPPATKSCFGKGMESATPPTLYQDVEDWNVRVFANKYPLVPDHEVIVHSPSDEKDIEDFPVEQTVKIIRAFLNRAHYHMNNDKEIMFFNNRGGKAGASITHPHSQLVALKGFPGIVEKEKAKALAYYNENNSCFWCDLVSTERERAERVVYESSHFVLLVPEASRWSYEMILIPKEHKPNFGYINEMEINDLALTLKAGLAAYTNLFHRPDRNFWIHTMRYEPFHWHIGFIPHIKVFGALELGAGIWVSDKATPEDAASKLRKEVKSVYESETVSIV